LAPSSPASWAWSGRTAQREGGVAARGGTGGGREKEEARIWQPWLFARILKMGRKNLSKNILPLFQIISHFKNLEESNHLKV